MINANKAINNLQRHVQSMMKVSSKYGKKMGTMGSVPFNSAEGSTYANEMAKSMARNRGDMGTLLDGIMQKAGKAGMSEEHLGRMKQLKGYMAGESGLERASDLAESIYEGKGIGGSDYKRSLQKLGFI